MSCCTAVEMRYTYQLAKFTISYINSCRFFNSFFFAFVLAYQLFGHTEYTMGEFIVWHLRTLWVRYVSYVEVSFQEKIMVDSEQFRCGHQTVFQSSFNSSSTAFARQPGGDIWLRAVMEGLTEVVPMAIIMHGDVRCCREQKGQRFYFTMICCLYNEFPVWSQWWSKKK